jgi:hypothetical protein
MATRQKAKRISTTSKAAEIFKATAADDGSKVADKTKKKGGKHKAGKKGKKSGKKTGTK